MMHERRECQSCKKEPRGMIAVADDILNDDHLAMLVIAKDGELRITAVKDEGLWYCRRCHAKLSASRTLSPHERAIIKRALRSWPSAAGDAEELAKLMKKVCP